MHYCHDPVAAAPVVVLAVKKLNVLHNNLLHLVLYEQVLSNCPSFSLFAYRPEIPVGEKRAHDTTFDVRSQLISTDELVSWVEHPESKVLQIADEHNAMAVLIGQARDTEVPGLIMILRTANSIEEFLSLHSATRAGGGPL